MSAWWDSVGRMAKGGGENAFYRIKRGDLGSAFPGSLREKIRGR